MIVDAHEDLAWNMMTFGRDYTRSVRETRALEAGTETVQHAGESLLGWPDWRRGDVGLIFAVLYATPEKSIQLAWDRTSYNDPEQAHDRYWSQLDLYAQMVEEHPDVFCLIQTQADLRRHQELWQTGPEAARTLGLVILMEGAEGVREPAELEAWAERGLRIVAPAWDANRYAGSCYTPGGFSPLGRELLAVMAELNLILDLTHLAEEAALEGLDSYPGRIIASHSNVRRLVPHARYPERHLSDTVIERLVERGGVVGIVLGNRFLKDGWRPGDPREQVGLAEVVAHIDAVCQLAGDAEHVGIGSDFDGGFGLDEAPTGLNSVADLEKVGAALARQGYTEDDVRAVLGDNWLRILRAALPED